ncbi:MAG: hypothetical protein HS111_21640 [Kofleriaceae bacterium]|nr:hypothetical protein [Kofleriaceae bacterium]
MLGSAVASPPDRLAAVRFAAGGALVLVRAQLAIAARLPADELGVLVIALLRLFQPDLPRPRGRQRPGRLADDAPRAAWCRRA